MTERLGPSSPTESEQEKNFRAAYGEDAWDSIVAESTRLGRKLTMDESAAIIEANQPKPKTLCDDDHKIVRQATQFRFCPHCGKQVRFA